MMSSNKRGHEDMHTMTHEVSPKRSKLDFLAMIAELSEKKEEEPKAMPTALVAQPETVEPPPLAKQDEKTFKPVITKKSPTKDDAPKSSFAAWKLAKGRKNTQGSKSPSRKEISSGRVNKGNELNSFESQPPAILRTEAVVTPTSPNKELPDSRSPMDVMAAAIELASCAPVIPVMAAAQTSPLVAPMDALAFAAASKEREMSQMRAACAPPLPPKKALKTKEASAKKTLSPKKAGASVKKTKDGTSTKKSTKKKKKEGKVKGVGKTKTKKSEPTSVKTSAFPAKIMELLQGNLASNAIYWLPEGEAIAVDPDNFKDSTVISKQFRGNKLSSFVRSLNRWGFRRIFYHSLPDKTLAFYHRLFQKQAPLLVKEMKMDGGEKEPVLPPGAIPMMAESNQVATSVVDAEPKAVESPVVRPMIGTSVESVPISPTFATSAPAIQISAPEPVSPPSAAIAREPVASAVLSASVAAAQPGAGGETLLERANALELAEGRHSLQQAMIAEQERSDLALQQLQAQHALLQSLAEQQNAAQAEELLMQSMIAEQQRSDLASQQRQAEQNFIQQMLADEQTAALAAALGGSSGAGGGVEAMLRERLLSQEMLSQQLSAGAPAPGADIMALMQQLQSGHQQQAREPSYMEQLLLLEQQRQRQEEVALLAAHGFRF